jgi:hypothetical protein
MMAAMTYTRGLSGALDDVNVQHTCRGTLPSPCSRHAASATALDILQRGEKEQVRHNGARFTE